MNFQGGYDMKREIDQDELLADVLVGESDLRQRTRDAGLNALRSRRLRRRVGGALVAVIPLVAIIVATTIRWPDSMREQSAPPARNLAVAEQVIPGTKIH